METHWLKYNTSLPPDKVIVCVCVIEDFKNSLEQKLF